MGIQLASNNIYNDSNEIKVPEQVINEVRAKDIIQNKSGENDITEKDIKGAVKKINTFLQDEHTHAEYYVHEEFNIIMIKIVDDDTKKVVLEVPPKKLIDMVAKMCELAGILVDKKA